MSLLTTGKNVSNETHIMGVKKSQNGLIYLMLLLRRINIKLMIKIMTESHVENLKNDKSMIRYGFTCLAMSYSTVNTVSLSC